MNRNDYDAIMRDITAGLTGDKKADARYLMERAEEYKDHPFSKEITRACGRLLAECVSEEDVEKVTRMLANDNKGIEATLEEARFCVFNKDYEKARMMIEPLVKEADENTMYRDDNVSEYHCFDELFEEIMYAELNQPAKELRRSDYPYKTIYSVYGSLLIDLKRFDEAREALSKARHWSPTQAGVVYEYGETYKMQGDFESFLSCTREAMEISFHSDDVARGFRNVGYYFIEKEMYPEAANCYFLSLGFERESSNAREEIEYISQKAPGTFEKTDSVDMQKVFESYNLTFGASKKIIGMAAAYADHFTKEGHLGIGKYLWEIVYDLTKDDSIKGIIEKLDAGLKGQGNLKDAFKTIGEVSFRELNNRYLYVHCPDIIDLFFSEKKESDEATGIFGYAYIDHEQGLSFQPFTLGRMTDDSIQMVGFPDDGNMYVFRFREGEGVHEERLDDRSMFLTGISPEHEYIDMESVFGEMQQEGFLKFGEHISESYDTKNQILQEMRNMEDIDEFRHVSYPDDVKVYLMGEIVKYEIVWVRLTNQEDGVFSGILLNQPAAEDFGIQKGDEIQFHLGDADGEMRFVFRAK